MYQVEDEPMETIHLYVVREGEKRPSLMPVIISVLALSLLIAIGVLTPYKQPEQRASIRVPAVPLPMRTFTARVAVIPTGKSMYPPTTAHGTLTITNGSVIAQVIPAGFLFSITSEVAVITDRSVYVPAGSANGYGYATTAAHVSVAAVNLPTLAVNQVLGTSLYVRNLQPFTGGHPAYAVPFVTDQDKQLALVKARRSAALQINGFHYPCEERYVSSDQQVWLTWRCQFVTYHLPPYLHVSSVRLIGKNFMITVWYVARPIHIWVK